MARSKALSDLSLFLTVALAHLLAVMSPGPDFAMVTHQTLAYGRRAGVWTAWGIGTGIIFHVAYGLFGLGWLLDQWPGLLEGLRYAGAAFLLWIGVQALRSPPAAASPEAERTAPAAARSYAIGVMTNVLNPKATLFFVALFASVITASTPNSLRWALGTWVVLSTAAWFSLVATLLSQARLQDRLRAVAHWIDRGMGVVLIALALAMLLR